MALIADAAYDAALAYIATNGTSISLCTSEPANYAAIAAAQLAVAPVTVGAPANGGTSGRSVTVPAISNDDADTTGTATHVALHNGAGLLVATVALSAPISVDAAGTYSLAAWAINIPDATAV
jgi:hypothetical protein